MRSPQAVVGIANADRLDRGLGVGQMSDSATAFPVLIISVSTPLRYSPKRFKAHRSSASIQKPIKTGLPSKRRRTRSPIKAASRSV